MCMPQYDQVLGGAIAAGDVIGDDIVGIQIGEIAVDQHKWHAIGLQPPDRLIVGNIANGKDDHAGHTVGP